MTALVVTLLLATPAGGIDHDGLALPGDVKDDPQAARIDRDRCLGAGAAGAVGVAVGAIIGGAVAYGLGAIAQASDVQDTTLSKQFDGFAIPLGAMAGAVAGAAAGTIGAWQLTADLAGKPPVTR